MRQPEVRCVEFVASVTDWMEGKLGERRRLALEEHLVICPWCTDYLAQLRAAMRMVAADAPLVAPPAATRDALLAEFRRAHGHAS